MFNRIRAAFDKWNDLLETCSDCGGETEDVNHDYLDGYTLCEYAIRCKECKMNIAYWAYGSWDGPRTKTEAVHIWLIHKKYDLLNFLDKRK